MIHFTRRAPRLKTSSLHDSDGNIQNTPKFALFHDSLQEDKRGGYVLCMRTILQCPNQMIFVFRQQNVVSYF